MDVSYERGTPVMIPHKSYGRQYRRERDWYLIAEQLVPAPHLARPEKRAAVRIVLVAVFCYLLAAGTYRASVGT